MRPRIDGQTATFLDALRRDEDEPYAAVIDRLLDGDVDLVSEPGETQSELRPRIPDDTAARLRDENTADERITDTIARLIEREQDRLRENYSDEELLSDLCEFADELDRVPSSSDMVRDGPHSTSTYITRFGSWSEAVRAAGMEPYDEGAGRPSLSDEALEENLRNVAEELGEPPRMADLKEHGEYSTTPYKRYESWYDALEAAGIDPEWPCPHSGCEETFTTHNGRETHARYCDHAPEDAEASA